MKYTQKYVSLYTVHTLFSSICSLENVSSTSASSSNPVWTQTQLYLDNCNQSLGTAWEWRGEIQFVQFWKRQKRKTHIGYFSLRWKFLISHYLMDRKCLPSLVDVAVNYPRAPLVSRHVQLLLAHPYTYIFGYAVQLNQLVLKERFPLIETAALGSLTHWLVYRFHLIETFFFSHGNTTPTIAHTRLSFLSHSLLAETLPVNILFRIRVTSCHVYCNVLAFFFCVIIFSVLSVIFSPCQLHLCLIICYCTDSFLWVSLPPPDSLKLSSLFPLFSWKKCVFRVERYSWRYWCGMRRLRESQPYKWKDGYFKRTIVPLCARMGDSIRWVQTKFKEVIHSLYVFFLSSLVLLCCW